MTGLWIGLMKAIYQEEFKKTKEERQRKRYWLKRFQADGFQLIDAIKKPISGKTRPLLLRKLIDRRIPSIATEIKAVGPKHVVLIKATIYEALSPALSAHGIQIENDSAIPFPSSGRQREFHDRMRMVLKRIL